MGASRSENAQAPLRPCGDLDELAHLVGSAGLDVTHARTHVGTYRAPSVDAFVTTEVESTPLLERISDDVYQRIRAEARDVLAPFTTANGNVEAPFETNVVVARRRQAACYPGLTTTTARIRPSGAPNANDLARLRESTKGSRTDLLATPDGLCRGGVAQDLPEPAFRGDAGRKVHGRAEVVPLCRNDGAGRHAATRPAEQLVILDGGDELGDGRGDADRVAVGEHRLVADELDEPRSARQCRRRCESGEVGHRANDLL
jgi:hypothetical protein